MKSMREKFAKLIAECVEAGHAPMLVVGRPAPKRQAITAGALYFRPLDGSDLSTCSCCANQFEQARQSRLVENYVPVNWCPACRERLREGEPRTSVLLSHEASRHRNGAAKRMAASREVQLSWMRANLPRHMQRRVEEDL